MNDNDLIIKLILEKLNEKVISIEKIFGGITNRTYKVATTTNTYVFRVPGEGTSEIINRKEEEKSILLANKLQIDAKLYYYDKATGIKISQFIVNSETLNLRTIKIEKNLIKVAELLKKLHTCKEKTKVDFDAMKLADKYKKCAINEGIELFQDFEIYSKYIEKLNLQYKSELVPCHNDTLCENWILSDEKLYLVDWEYAGMNDYLWDLADLSIEAKFDDDTDAKLLGFYHLNSNYDLNRFYFNKINIDYLWSLWGLARIPYDSSMEDYSYQRWVRMKQNIKKYKLL